MDEELKNLTDDEGNKSGDGAVASAPPRPPSTTPSVTSADGDGAKGAKRRTWKKPKDKPKRPLSAYNIFFKHERSRIVEGKPEDPSADEIIRSIENILATSRETRRHRKTHGRISFGDLARKIADKWKSIGAEQKAVFDHYAELDMRRYRKEVKAWKEKKDNEAVSAKREASLSDSMNNSFSSLDSLDSEFSLDHLSNSSGDAWAPRRTLADSMNSSFSSSCSLESELSLEPIPIEQMMANKGLSTNLKVAKQVPSNANLAPDVSLSMKATPDYSSISSLQQSMASLQASSGASLQQNSDQSLQFGQQSLSSLQESIQQQQQQTDQLHQQLQQSLQQQKQLEQLQRLQQLQQQQQQLTQLNQFRQPNQPGQPRMDPVPFEQVFPNAAARGNGNDLENFLSNLDLSNV